MDSPAFSFDRVAELYERARPGYPDAVFDRILEYSGVDEAASILEIGAGSGKATLPFAKRGLRILALEPSPRLAAVARTKLLGFPHVQIRLSTFEHWTAEPNRYDLIYAAQSFHWLDGEQRLCKSKRQLRRSGVLAVFGNFADIRAEPSHEAIEEAYAQHAPGLRGWDPARDWYGSSSSPMLDELKSSALFEDLRHDTYSWRQTLSAAEYCALLQTRSDHSTLPSEVSSKLIAAIGDAIEACGNEITLKYRTGLFLARA